MRSAEFKTVPSSFNFQINRSIIPETNPKRLERARDESLKPITRDRRITVVGRSITARAKVVVPLLAMSKILNLRCKLR
jgi:hypothetical protein